MTVLAWAVSNKYLEQDARQRFEKNVQGANLDIQTHMLGYKSVLRAGAGLFYSSDSVSRDEWRIFVNNLQLNKTYPGIQGLGYAAMVPAEAKAAFELQTRLNGAPDFAIYPAGQRDPYSAVVYLEPLDWRNQRAIGYDMYSEPVRHEAMQRACDNGEIALSGNAVLAQETGKNVQQGFLMYMPIYRKGMSVQTVTERRAALVGFVYGVFRAGDLMHGLLGEGLQHYSFSLYDGEAIDENRLMFHADATEGHSRQAEAASTARSTGNLVRQPRFTEDVHYVIGGHAWTAHFASSRSFEHETASLQPALIALAGTSADLLLFFALYSISRNHRKLKQSHAELVVSQEALARERGRYERLVENVPGLVYRCATTEPWTALFVSQRVIELSGVPAAEFMEGRRGFGDFIHPDDKDSVAESIRTATVAGKPYEIEFRFGKTDGTWLWVVSRGQAQYGDTGEPLWLDGVTFDITESRRQQQEIVERELRYRAVIEAATDGFWLVDREGNLIGVNAAYCRMSGYSESELLGHKIQDLELERGGLEDRLAKVESHGHDRYEALHRRKDGTTWPAEVTITVMPSASEVFFFIRDLTTIKAFEAERVRFEEQMRSLAFHDPLTRLPNRRLLSDRLKQALAASIRNGTHGALLFLDMDNFKHLNDSLGHEMGDLLLVEVAQRLKASVREADTVARFGGDEFVVMLPGLSVSGEESALHARSVGEKILAALNQPYQLDGHVYHSTPSIGVTLFLGKGDDVDAILKRADVAMYQSKAAGRNMLRFFDAGMEHLVGERELLNACLRGETRDNELVLHYQPVLDLSGMIVGVEALARWRHPERGLLLPAQFMMLVEDSGLAVLLGHRTLEKACRQLAAWAGNPNMSAVDMTVNIGLRHVGHPSFVEEVERALAASGADPRRLIFELGEALVLQDNVLPLDVIRQVRAMGIRISLDNFGTCYMSLATLITELSVDQLKLTMDGLPADRSDAVRSALLDALAVLGRLLDTVVVAKGVETEAQLDVLRSQGWKQVQGYLFGRPLPSDELEALWAKW